MTSERTFLAYQHDAKLYTLETKVLSVLPFNDLEESNRQFFKGGDDDAYVIVVEKTIFHPQGGGQPSDVGTISASGITFDVASVRMDLIRDGQALHFGRFSAESNTETFKQGDTVQLAIDIEKRLLYSRFHTAGHVLGAAVRHLVEDSVDGFDELKANHFPDAASCEFQGLIDGKWKAPVQARLDAYLAAKMPVRVDWWDEDDFRRRGLERLIPGRELLGGRPGEKFRVVDIVGAEVYPCGGTHVDSTDLCGETTVKKISRSKGRSRVSYTVKQ